MSFHEEVLAFNKKAVNNARITTRGTAIKLFSAVIMGSPVGKYDDGVGGRFRGNWFATFVNPSVRMEDKTDTNGSRTVEAMEAKVNQATGDRDIILTNNLPYAATIEYGGYPGDGPNTIGGYSKQAPHGVVRVNITRFETILNQEAKKHI